jgi:hypothetical protein
MRKKRTYNQENFNSQKRHGFKLMGLSPIRKAQGGWAGGHTTPANLWMGSTNAASQVPIQCPSACQPHPIWKIMAKDGQEGQYPTKGSERGAQRVGSVNKKRRLARCNAAFEADFCRSRGVIIN